MTAPDLTELHACVRALRKALADKEPMARIAVLAFAVGVARDRLQRAKEAANANVRA